MKNVNTICERIMANVHIVLILGCAMVAVGLVSGCRGFCLGASGFALGSRTLQGTILDADTLEGLSTAVIRGFTVSEGEQTGEGGTASLVDEHPPADDGSFEFKIYSGAGSSCTLGPFSSTVVPVPPFPPIDQIELIVTRDGCEQQFTIEINADTVVDLSFPDNVIELKDPILVPPCVP